MEESAEGTDERRSEWRPTVGRLRGARECESASDDGLEDWPVVMDDCGIGVFDAGGTWDGDEVRPSSGNELANLIFQAKGARTIDGGHAYDSD